MTWFIPWRAYVAEFLGTLVFVLIASSSVLANVFYGDIGTVGVALASGLGLAVVMYAIHGISGGHLNPVVTLAMWLSQRMIGSTAVIYILAQLLASFAAAGLIFLIFGTRSLEFSLGAPSIGANFQNALVAEIVFSSILVFAYFATMIGSRGPMGPLVVGLVVLVSIIAIGSLSGAVLNPARVLGPAVLSKSYHSLAVYLVGPTAGSIFGVAYDFLFLRKMKK